MTRMRLHYAWVIVIVGTLVVFGALGLGRFAYGALLPAMQADLGMTNTQAGVLATVNLVGYLAFSVIGGAAATRVGSRLVITVGIALVAVGLLFTGLAKGFAALMVWRFVTGAGSGASNVPVLGLLSAWYGSRRRGLAMGICVAGSSIALIFVGPLVPRILGARGPASWRLCWFIFAAIATVLALGSGLLMRNHPAEKGLAPFGHSADGAPEETSHAPLRWAQVYRAVPVWHLGFVYAAFGFSYIIYMTFFSKHLIPGVAIHKWPPETSLCSWAG